MVAVASTAFLYASIFSVTVGRFDQALLDKARIFSGLSTRGADDINGREVAFDDLSASVRKTITSHAQLPVEVEAFDRNGTLVYKVEYLPNGVETEFLVAATGEFLGPLDEYQFAFREAGLPEFQRPGADYYQVWDEDGDTTAKSASLGDASLPKLSAAAAPTFSNLQLPDGISGRAVALTFTPQHGSKEDVERLTLVLARSREELDDNLGFIASVLAVFVVVLAAASMLAAGWTVKRGLRPLTNLADQTAGINPNDLAFRFTSQDQPAELRAVTQRLNDLLARLEKAFARERRFTSNAAHELRTPIAELRTVTEVGLRELQNRTEEADPEIYLADSHEIALQLERLVTALLGLARTDSGRIDVQPEDFDLVTHLRNAWVPFDAQAREKRVDVQFRVPEALKITTDRTLFNAIITNLLSNAVSHVPRDGFIHISVNALNGEFSFEVSNTNPALTTSDIEHLAEAFWMKDAARSRAEHSGLGLSIAHAFAGVLQLGIEASLSSEDAIQVTLSGLIEYGRPKGPSFD